MKDCKPEEHEEVSEKQTNIITSLAEKAMSVAGPVVPTKKGGEVDQERSEHIFTTICHCLFPVSII